MSLYHKSKLLSFALCPRSGSRLLTSINRWTPTHISKGRYISWSSHYICGENIEGELEKIALSSRAPSKAEIQPTTKAASAQTHERYEVALLLISKCYAPRIINLAGGYIKEKLGIKNLVGAVVDGVKFPSSHNESSSSQGIYLLLGENEERVQDKTPLNNEWEITPFYHYSSKINKLGENSVGRWKTEVFVESSKKSAGSKGSESKVEIVENHFSDFTSISQATNDVGIPPELKESVDHESGMFILASEREGQQYIDAIDKQFPLARKFGILSASTPFINGLSSTIYQGDKIHSEGIAGVYFRPAKHAKMVLDYPESTPLGPAMKITKCRGNIILELDNGNATGILLSQLKKFTGNKILKDEDLYISLDSLKGHQDIYRIESGDPSKGAMAVSTSMDLPLGATVQFFRLARSFPSPASTDAKYQMKALIIPTEDHFASSPFTGNPAIVNESGFIFGEGSENPTSVVNIPYTAACLDL
ncbi:hypothetical protein DSO57_1009942 [Entomophthora muscae]|uniref:Uncharacterized protein n=1 Tax=Entomophthora muscae TaxID=34485 RepID=A0ACC2THP2_9FUNG|nr:hypothetical protein DSO57_1009942 [Entomophthora muscae]